MTDRELLELAAKAAGYEITDLLDDYRRPAICVDGEWRWLQHWNPLEDDGDAMRLANRLGLSITHTTCEDDAPIVRVGYDGIQDYTQLPAFPDCNAATRRAITRAAAEIGRRMSDNQ